MAGIVLGGVDSQIMDTMQRGKMPTLALLEGYGSSFMSPQAFALLAALEGATAAITRRAGGTAADRSVLAVSMEGYHARVEPEDVGNTGRRSPVRGTELGDRVRAVRRPAAGIAGVVKSISTQPIRTPSGYELEGALVQRDTDVLDATGSIDPVCVPWLNLERIVREEW